MTPEQFERAAKLFDSALELPTPQREAFLNSACADDGSVRLVVEKMLAEQGAGSSFLDRPAFGRDFNVASAAGIDADRLAEEVAAIGRYQGLVKIAEGGFGVVYRAEQVEPVRRQVALKVLKLGMDTQQILRRFEAERQTLALMQHPNIAMVLDAGTTARGRPFFVMELVSGSPITQYCDSARLDLSSRIELFSQVCQAVQHAHQKGIIHRDLKPSNVLIVSQEDGAASAKVIDFGISRAIERGSPQSMQLTQEGSFLGTPQYMSPEQAAGSGDIDTRTDVYAMGVMLYEILAGVTPFDAAALIVEAGRERTPTRPSARISRSADVQSIASQRNTDPLRLARTLRGDLDWILLKCLEHDRANRYASADALDADLRRFLNHEPILARPPSRADALKKFVRRNRGGVATAALVTLAVVGGLIFSLIGFSQARRQRALADARNEELRFQLYVSQIERAQRIIETDGSERAKPILDQTDPILRGWEWQRLHWLADRSESTVSAHGTQVVSVDCSSDGKSYLTAGADNVIRMWDAGTLQVTRELTMPAAASSGAKAVHLCAARLSPDRKLIAAATKTGDIVTWEASTSRQLRAIHVPDESIGAIAISPDNRYVAVCSGSTPTRIYDVSTGELTRTLDARAARASAVAWSPDSSRILVGLIENLVIVCRADEGTVELTDRGADFVVRDAKFSPDGSRIVSLGMDGQIYMRNASDASLLYKVPVARQNPERIAISPDGKLLAVAGADGVVTLLDSADGKKRQSLRGHENPIHDIVFGRDGLSLVSVDDAGVLKKWRLAPGFDDIRYQHVNGMYCAAFAENGAVVFCGGIGLGVMRIDLRSKTKTNNELLELARAISSRPDGQRIAVCGIQAQHVTVVMLLSEKLQPLQKWPASNDSSVSLSVDGKYVLFTDPDETLVVRASETGDIFRRIPKDSPHRCATWAPDGRTVVSGHADGRVRSWNCERQESAIIWMAQSDGEVSDVAFSAAGRHLMTRSKEGQVKVWSWPACNLIATLPTSKITAAAITPDGTQIAVAGDDSLVSLWNVAKGRQTMTIGRHSAHIISLTFSNDGALLASAGDDHILNIWRTRPIALE